MESDGISMPKWARAGVLRAKEINSISRIENILCFIAFLR
jgi:hypothetical protein